LASAASSSRVLAVFFCTGLGKPAKLRTLVCHRDDSFNFRCLRPPAQAFFSVFLRKPRQSGKAA
jgi:hypothetical protein